MKLRFCIWRHGQSRGPPEVCRRLAKIVNNIHNIEIWKETKSFIINCHVIVKVNVNTVDI